MKPLCFHQTCPSFPRKRNNESQLSDQDTTFGGSKDASQSHLSFSLRNDWPLPHTSDLTKAFRSYGIIWLQTRRLKRRASFFFNMYSESKHRPWILTGYNSFKWVHSNNTVHIPQGWIELWIRRLKYFACCVQVFFPSEKTICRSGSHFILPWS